MGQLILIALRNLASHRRRSALLGGAIAAVTALLVVLLGLSVGIRETMLRSATTLMTGHVNVAGFYKVTAGQAAPVVIDYKQVEDAVRQIVGPDLKLVTHRGRGWSKLVSDTGSMQVGIGGIDIDNEPGFREVVQVRSGSLDGLRKPNGILLFEKQAEKLGVKVGDTLTYSAQTPRGVNNTLDVEVVAIAADVGLFSGWNTYVNEQALRRLYQFSDDTTGAIMVYLRDLGHIKAVEERLRKELPNHGYALLEDDPRAFWMKFDKVNREDWTGQKLDVTNWEDEISFIRWTVTAIDALSFMLMFVLLVIIAVGIMNTLWIAIRERTREIGTLRAIGMQRRRVLWMFVIEGFCLGVLGTLTGAVVGLLTITLINAAGLHVPVAVQLFVMSDTLRLVPSPGGMLFSILLITGCTTIIAMFPSFLAARMKPITAMHHLG